MDDIWWTCQQACERGLRARALNPRQDDAFLRLVLPFFVFVGNLADFVRLEEEDLAQSFVRINARGQRSSVGDFQGDVAFPLRLERGYVHDDAAARVCRFSDADGEDAARNLEVFHRAGKSERIRRNDADRARELDEGSPVELFGVYDGAVDVGKNLEFVRNPKVITV